MENKTIVEEGEKLIKIYENDLEASFVQECFNLEADLENSIKSPSKICTYLWENGLKGTLIKTILDRP